MTPAALSRAAILVHASARPNAASSASSRPSLANAGRQCFPSSQDVPPLPDSEPRAPASGAPAASGAASKGVANGVRVQLRPYGGPGGGARHHAPAKKAFEGDSIYNANRAIAVPISELRAHGVNHAVVSCAQKTLYTQARPAGQAISWELMERVKVQALIRRGMSPQLAPDVVRRSIDSLNQQGCTPRRVPWGP